ncbi:hypothetical protein BpHYR1_048243 [Brachionus plicatilis]|uniref:Uncharacterized protein n=1 Tax=Brachionus plicatilis TaxID=10195 RepID=A0A3M7PVJ3_BRAPC|nr:hypothetical protein BpHYR1_048243 [Brachionus plicatilis]
MCAHITNPKILFKTSPYWAYASKIMMTKPLKKKEEDEESDGDETIIDQTVSKKKGVNFADHFQERLKCQAKRDLSEGI